MEFGSKQIALGGSRLATFRATEREDEPFLVDLYGITRLEELALTNWDEAQRQAFVRMQFDAQQVYYRQSYPKAEHLIILLNGEMLDGKLLNGERAGRLYVAEKEAEIRIIDVTILTEYRNAGIGAAIIRRLMEEATQIGKPLTIYVESFNPSYRLFKRLGFVKSGESSYSDLLEWRAGAAIP